MQILASNPGLPGRARNSSCNPKRAAGSEHGGLLAQQHPNSEILFKVPPGARPEDERGLCGMPVARQGVKNQQSLGRLPKTSAGSAGWPIPYKTSQLHGSSEFSQDLCRWKA